MHSDNDDDRTGGVVVVHTEQRVWAIVAYVLHLLGAVLGLPSIIAVIMNYVLRDSVTPELRSHHDWMIRTFFWALAWTVLTWLLWITLIGIPLAVALGIGVWVWWLYRHVRGLVTLADQRPMPG